MSLAINSPPPPLIPPLPNDPQTIQALNPQDEYPHKEKHPVRAHEESRQPDFFKLLDRIFSEHQLEGKHFQKAVHHLARSLEKAFGAAPGVDRDTAEEEMLHGGLKRVGKDLSKLFRGLGIPKGMARQLAGGMTDALMSGEVGQVKLSLTATRAFDLELQQTSQTYLASGDGAILAATSSSLRLTAIQVRSLDFSINLSSGEFSLSNTRFEALSLHRSTSNVLLTGTPQSAGEEGPAAALPAADPNAALPEPAAATAAESAVATAPELTDAAPDDFAALVQTDSQLRQISRIVQQSALMQLKPVASETEASDPAETEPSDGLRALQDLLASLEELRGGPLDLFEPLVNVRNLRVEKEGGSDHLRFTLDALAPTGLQATNAAGRASTLYPRPDGSLARREEDEVQVSA